MAAAHRGVQEGLAEAVSIEFYITFDAKLRQGQLGGWAGRVCAVRGSVRRSFLSRFLSCRATAFVMCGGHVPSTCYFTVFSCSSLFLTLNMRFFLLPAQDMIHTS